MLTHATARERERLPAATNCRTLFAQVLPSLASSFAQERDTPFSLGEGVYSSGHNKAE
jgi:hypothetical protein